jgi:RNA polymerase sigma-70 factor (ECF subfamily)
MNSPSASLYTDGAAKAEAVARIGIGRNTRFGFERGEKLNQSVKYTGACEEEFERVAMVHTEKLLRAAVRFTRNLATAEDLVQEALLRAWRAFDQFERGTNCKAWLFRILLNLWSKQRHKIQSAPPVISLEEYVQMRVAAPGATPLVDQADVFAALDSLPEEHRTVLVLAVVEGFTCKEIAAMIGVPIGTVMSRLSRARVGLRKKLTATGHTGHVNKAGRAESAG